MPDIVPTVREIIKWLAIAIIVAVVARKGFDAVNKPAEMIAGLIPGGGA